MWIANIGIKQGRENSLLLQEVIHITLYPPITGTLDKILSEFYRTLQSEIVPIIYTNEKVIMGDGNSSIGN